MPAPSERTRCAPTFGAVLGHTLVVVSDAHLGVAPPAAEEALLEFFDAVPTLGDCLLVNGDLFDFWFSYSRVIPRRGFHVAAALAGLRRRMPIVMVGGNHDRWDNRFWERDLGVRFEPRRASFEIGRRKVMATHGDGLTETTWQARLLHRLIQHPATAGIYRILHPELGFRLVDVLSPALGDHTLDESTLDRASARQRLWAERYLNEEPAVGLVIMGHTHRAVISGSPGGRQYLNPGAWFDGFRYAVATETGAQLCTFGQALTPTAPPPPFPIAPR
ncbi:MAG TPA: UDP-2,3-diacylglucosamine diphosphatase [Gemmatimonadales bacterium]|nr:UDP-2,3-diacylglucosamine diphosphatase [Gemmatimonadales bacterium]